MTKYYSKGFTIVELSMVIVIISTIIVAAIFASSMTKSAKIQRLINDLSYYKLSIDTFGTKYGNGAIPGDYDRAYDLWGSACASSAAACNGNGDSVIQYFNGSNNYGEHLRIWQHLNLAGIIPQRYSGVAVVAGESTPGVNIPESSWGVAVGVEFYTQASTPTGPNGLAVQIAGKTAGSWAKSPIMMPQDANAIDLKIDDGVANTGYVLGMGNSCATGGTYSTQATISCYIRYMLLL